MTWRATCGAAGPTREAGLVDHGRAAEDEAVARDGGVDAARQPGDGHQIAGHQVVAAQVEFESNLESSLTYYSFKR